MRREPGSITSPLTSPLGDDLTAEDVAAYLRDHPDFLASRSDLIPHLVPPSADRGEGVLDMQYFLLQKLRGELATAQTRQRELIATTRANLNNQNRVHAAVLFLLDAQSFEQLIQTITTDLAVLLDLDVTALAVEGLSSEIPHVQRQGVRVLEPGTVDSWLGAKRDVVLRGDIDGMPEIYGRQGAGLVRSEALVRLRIGGSAPQGILALGSREPDMFDHGQGTELLTFLARVVERTIRLWLDIPAR